MSESTPTPTSKLSLYIPDDAVWEKAAYSNTVGNQCVELAKIPGGVAMRDSKNPEHPALMYTRDEAATFFRAIKGGEFDHLV